MTDTSASYLDIYNSEDRDLFNDGNNNDMMSGGGDDGSSFNTGLLSIITIMAVVLGVFVLFYFNRPSTDKEQQNSNKGGSNGCTTGLCPLQKIFS
jgi:hypothetical protein